MTNGRKACTSGHRCRPATLGEVLYCVVHHSRLSAVELAERIGVRPGYLLDAANPDRQDAQFQLRLLVPLTLQSGNDALIRYIARGCGGVFIALPKVDAGQADATGHAAFICREIADVLETPVSVLATHRLAVEDAAVIDREIAEAIEALASYQQHVRAKTQTRALREAGAR